MGNGGANLTAAFLVVMMCVVATCTGYVFYKLSSTDDIPEYSVDDVCIVSGIEYPCSGTVSFKQYSESTLESLMSFVFDIKHDDSSFNGSLTVAISADSKKPAGGLFEFVDNGSLDDKEITKWKDRTTGNYTIYVDDKGAVLKIDISDSDAKYTVHRTS